MNGNFHKTKSFPNGDSNRSEI